MAPGIKSQLSKPAALSGAACSGCRFGAVARSTQCCRGAKSGLASEMASRSAGAWDGTTIKKVWGGAPIWIAAPTCKPCALRTGKAKNQHFLHKTPLFVDEKRRAGPMTLLSYIKETISAAPKRSPKRQRKPAVPKRQRKPAAQSSAPNPQTRSASQSDSPKRSPKRKPKRQPQPAGPKPQLTRR